MGACRFVQRQTSVERLPWVGILNPEYSFLVEVSCSKSKIYYSGVAAERIERTIEKSLKVGSKKRSDIKIMARIDYDICTIIIATSGELLHKRGFRMTVNKAHMRQNMAALFLQECGYKGDEPVYDPMCGSGTFVIEATEIAIFTDDSTSSTWRLTRYAFSN